MRSARSWKTCEARRLPPSGGIRRSTTRRTPGASMAKAVRAAVVAPRRIAVLGAGSWGTTFAKILADGGSDVVLWARRPELAREINEVKRNSDYLEGINLPRNLRATSRLGDAMRDAEPDPPLQSRGDGPVPRAGDDRRQPDEGRREGDRPADERGDRAGPARRAGAHRRRV